MSNLARLRAHTVAQSLFAPTTLEAALDKLGFVQVDPIRATWKRISAGSVS